MGLWLVVFLLAVAGVLLLAIGLESLARRCYWAWLRRRERDEAIAALQARGARHCMHLVPPLPDPVPGIPTDLEPRRIVRRPCRCGEPDCRLTVPDVG